MVFLREKANRGNKGKIYLRGTPIAWDSGRILTVATYSYAGGIRAVSHGFGAACFLKSTLTELLFGNGYIDIATRIINDNSIVIDHVHSVNSVAKERRLTGPLESKRYELETNPWLALSQIMEPLNISDEMTKTTARRKPILLSRNTPQKSGEKVKGGTRKHIHRVSSS